MAPPKKKAVVKKAPPKAKVVVPKVKAKAPKSATPLIDKTPGKEKIRPPTSKKLRKPNGVRLRNREILTSPKIKNGMPPEELLAGGKYHDSFPDLLRRFNRIGKALTDLEVGQLFEVSVGSVESWIRKYPEFKLAIMEGREISNARCERALFERAIGYSHPEDKVFYNAKTGETISVRGTKHYPPDVPALTLWLTNRKPQDWKNKVEHVVPPGAGRRLVIAEVDTDGNVEVVSEQ